MRVRGDTAPVSAFSLEPQPNKPGMALVRFYQNVEPVESGYEYDEYRLVLTDTGNLEADIENNYEHHLDTAVQEELDRTPDSAELRAFMAGIMEGYSDEQP